MLNSNFITSTCRNTGIVVDPAEPTQRFRPDCRKWVIRFCISTRSSVAPTIPSSASAYCTVLICWEMTIKCSDFSNETLEPGTSNSISFPSSILTSTDQEPWGPGYEFNSQISGTSTESSGVASASSTNISPGRNNLRVFTFPELKAATKNFSRSVVIGEGGFGCVYKGVVKCSKDPCRNVDVAVKQLGRRGLQGHKEWLTEVNVLGVVEHSNLVRLVGYCAEDDERGIQRLLVYEYMPNRSVEDHLSKKYSTPLPWGRRLKIAEDSACGLAYLHEQNDFQIIFRDFKASNILLDEQWNAKLSDFGLARQGPSEGLTHVSTAVVGTIGYAAPEYMQTGRLTAKSDVWSYGVFLYELITGRRPMDRNRPKGEQNLMEWIKPYLSDKKKFQQIIDPRLEGKYYLKSVLRLADVANRCLRQQARRRPKMSEVAEMVNRIVEAEVAALPESIPVKIPELNNSPGDAGNEKLGFRRRIADSKIVEYGLSLWRSWRSKLILSH